MKKANLFGTKQICHSCGSGVSMVLTCTDSEYDRDNQYTASLVGVGSEQLITTISETGYQWAGGTKTAILGNSGAILTIMLLLSVVGSALFSPIIAIILGIIGLFVAVFLQLTVLSLTAVTGLAIAGAIIIWRMQK